MKLSLWNRPYLVSSIACLISGEMISVTFPHTLHTKCMCPLSVYEASGNLWGVVLSFDSEEQNELDGWVYENRLYHDFWEQEGSPLDIQLLDSQGVLGQITVKMKVGAYFNEVKTVEEKPVEEGKGGANE